MKFNQFVYNLSLISFLVVFAIHFYKGYGLAAALLRGGIAFVGVMVVLLLFFGGLIYIISLTTREQSTEEEAVSENEMEQEDAAGS